MDNKLVANEVAGLYAGAKSRVQMKSDTGDDDVRGSGSGTSGVLKVLLPVLIILIALVGIVALIIAMPMMVIGAIDYNLQKALGFTDTVAILEEQGEYVTAELAKAGKFPSEYSTDLAKNGVDVGQVTANGDFIKTDTYIANIEEKEGLVAAAGGFSYSSDDGGGLALLFEGQVIRADDFVAAVESDPKLYAAYSNAADISAKYYYGKDVSDAYKEMGLSRGNFNTWERTGDYKADEESFVEILNQVLDNNATTLVGGVQDDEKPLPALRRAVARISHVVGDDDDNDKSDDKDGTFEENISSGDASEITSTVAEKTKGYIISWHPGEITEDVTDANGNVTGQETYAGQVPDPDNTQTKRAAELLNSAVSAKEPYTAANTFLAIEEPIQRARIGDNGPINELMNVISTPTSVSYENIYTGAIETKELSILETVNFQAAVGEKNYSKDEAANFSRDRVLYTTGQADKEVINKTVVTTNGGQKSESAVRNGKGESADEEVISRANNSIALAISEKNSTLFQSVIGANRVLEGGSFISNTLNKKAIGAMPSDAATVAAYQVEVDKAVARKEEAERATLSPFDISSPNTFLGSIVHGLATTILGSYRSGGSSLISAVTTAGSTTSDAVSNILGTAKAEGSSQKFTTLSQDNCETVGTVEVEGDLYCTSHNTVDIQHMSYSLSDWQNSEIGDSIDEDGNIVEGSDLEKFVIMGMDRESTVGVSSADVCEASRNYDGNIFDRILKFFGNIVGLYSACKGVDMDLATGAKYSFSTNQDENLALYSGYMLHNQVYSLLTGEESGVAIARERYYAKYPKDNSEAGVIARISGMTKYEAEIALAYNDYLNEIANYNPAERYRFGVEDLGLDTDTFSLRLHSDKMAGDYVAWYMKEAEYRDLRELTTSA